MKEDKNIKKTNKNRKKALIKEKENNAVKKVKVEKKKMAAEKKGKERSVSSKRVKEKKKKNLKSTNSKENKKQKSIKELQLSMGILDVLLVIVITAVCSCLITGLILNYQYKKNNPFYKSLFSSNSHVEEFAKIYTEVLDNFYEEVDEEGLVDSAIKGMMEYLKDNYSIYLDKEDSDSLEESLSGSYEGIGIIAYGNLVYSVIEDSPAQKAGLQEGDLITKINDTIIDKSNINAISDLISASEKNINLLIKRGEEEISVEIEKSTVIMQVVEGQILKKNNKAVGYIKLSDFSQRSFEQFEKKLEQLESEGLDSLIIDLRGNSGGYLNRATEIASLFLEKEKLIYSLENKNGVTDYKDNTNEKREYSVVVLINESTASAAEVLASALKDSYGAFLVGKTSYGKGKVQNMIENDGNVVKYTSAKWLRPNGECIDTKGIKPDYDINNIRKENIVYDKQLEKAIDLLVS